MANINTSIVILAAGEGTRMRSRLPKVLHPLAGKPLLQHVVDTALELGPAEVVVVYGHGGEQVRKACESFPVRWVEQPLRRGTGDAVACALAHIQQTDNVLVLCGDVPMVSAASLQGLLDGLQDHDLALMSMIPDDPKGYGRIVRDADGRPVRIVEQKDATPTETALREVNTGFLAARTPALRSWIERLRPDNAQGEYYLTDCLRLAVEDGAGVTVITAADAGEFLGVNDRVQLASLERRFQRQRVQELMRSGVTVMDPERLDIRGEVQAGIDVTLDVNVILEGHVTLETGVRVGPHCVLKDVHVGADVVIRSHCVIEDAVIGAGATVGPFARLRPGSRLEAQSHIGNFVEVKNSHIGQNSKVNHLSYIGDSELGRDVNIGAGTITCNYDGANKHRTVIEDGAFIGSNSALVAPVTVGKEATIGAGSTIVKSAPPGKLTLERAPQKTLDGWKRPVKKS